MSQAAPGWYADPGNAAQLRWYDGARWTEHVQATPAAGSLPAGQLHAQQHHAQQQNGCQVCGALPVDNFNFREHHGMIVMQRFVSYRGRWCRDCALEQFGHAQRRTLIFGWWGLISFFANIIAVFQNVAGRQKARALGVPVGRQGPTIGALRKGGR